MSDLVQQVKDFFESDEDREYVLETTVLLSMGKERF